MTINKRLILIFFAVVAMGTIYFFVTQKKNTPATTQTTDQTANWKTYKNEKVSFKFPSQWIETPLLIQGSGYTQEFNDPEKKYNFTFSSSGNYSQITGKPYANIDEYINMPYKVKVVTVDGTEGRQGLPRAGSENINSVNFFSKDSKFIYTLELKTGNTTLDTSEAEVANGQKLFDQILSTFKFTDQTNSSDQESVNSLVSNFYKALEAQDGKLLFSYFTPPSTTLEKTSFDWLTGAGLPGTPVYRVFFRQKISNPKINETQVNDTVFVVKISDQLTGVPSAGSETTVYTPQTRNVVLTIIKSGDKWMVDKFTDPLAKTGTQKYNGFDQGY